MFQSSDVLNLRLQGPLTSLSRDRAGDPEYREARLTFPGADGSAVTEAVKLRPRGRSRRDRAVCTVPPLRVNLPRKAVRGTVFHGQDKLKLVTHCRRSSRHDRYVYLEYLTYRLLNVVSDAGFRVRPLDVEYVDDDRDGRTDRRFGFFIEDDERLARRLGLAVVKPAATIGPGQLEPWHATLMGLYQFMIGNTDFSFIAPPVDDHCCHNVVLMENGAGQLLPMPYDFDITGFVDPPYAVVDQQLPIRNVRQRLFRGFCRPGDDMDRALAHFRERRAALLTVVDGETPLDAGSRRDARSYVEGFFAILDDPRDLQRMITGACRDGITSG